MAILHFLAITLCGTFLFFLSDSKSLPTPGRGIPIFKPNVLVLPVQRDASTGLHWAYMLRMQIPVLVDLNGKHLWINCDKLYSSKTYQAPFCHSTQCSRANSLQCLSCSSASKPGCHQNTCGLLSTNPVTQQSGMGELGQDVLEIHATRGYQLGPVVSVPQFLFSCAPSFLAQKGLPNNVQGVVGLGHSPISLPAQLASHFGLQRQFTMCLSRYPTSKGAILFGDAPYNLRQFRGQDIFHDMAFTPLTVSPMGEYSVKVNAIRVNQQTVPVNPSKLPSASTGSGIVGTRLCTSTPYTVLHHSIFEALTQLFVQKVPKEAQVKPVAPFGLCFDSKKINAYPSLDFVLDRPDMVWRMSGEALMVQAQPGVTCLGFVDGGMHPMAAAITIGAQQLQENLLVFDLARSRLGINPYLNSHGIKCADLFNFTNL